MRNRAFVFFACFLLSACAHTGPYADPQAPPGRDYDVSLVVTPMMGKLIDSDTVVDVIENRPDAFASALTIVSFKINEVLKGEFTRVKIGGPSKWEQMKEAASKGQALKLLTLDFEAPEDEQMKGWVNVAVADAFDTFGIRNYKAPGDGLYKLYLKRAAGQEDGYLLVRVYAIRESS